MELSRFWKLIFFFLTAVIFIMGCALIFLWQKSTPEEIHTLIDIALLDGPYITNIIIIFLFLCLAGFQIVYATLIKPLKKICSEAEMIYSTNPAHRIKIAGEGYFKRLSTVINDFADMFENLNRTITGQILTARKETEKERNLLAAIMSELPQGVIICNINGRVLLFNSHARKTFSPDSPSDRSEIYLGLGRSVFHLFDKSLIAHAIEEIEDRLSTPGQSVVSRFITPIYTGRLISTEAIPVMDSENRMTGFILAFQDVTDKIKIYDVTHEKLVSLKTDVTAQINDIRQILDQDGLKPARPFFIQAEAIKMLDILMVQYEQVTETLLDVISEQLPLTRYQLTDFILAFKQKTADLFDIQADIDPHSGTSHILIDTYSFTTALMFLFQNISRLSNTRLFSLSAIPDKGAMMLEIIWKGRPIPKNEIDGLMQQKISSLSNLLYILKQNKASFQVICDKTGHSSQINVIVKTVSQEHVREKHQAPVITGSRPEFYDLDLFAEGDENKNLMDTDLRKLTYTVFDTETTGLNPDGGDEIISLAAVRIVNSRIVYQDIFEELVDPQRDIPVESYHIHGINYEMVAGKKQISHILPAFRDYAEETVLLGHNIAFDMKMFKVKEKLTGVKFQNPVLDTLLLSAILHPVHEHHDMESIATRLGVQIIGRHTALGDAIATAEIFLKLLPILSSNGILTLRDAVNASKKTYYARLKY